MIVEVDGHEVHAATGGVEPSSEHPTVVLIHGAGMDSTIWSLQTRYLAHRGVRALAVDLPGHGRSGGRALGSIAELADWLVEFVAATHAVGRVHLVGHSMGSLIALEAAVRLGDRAWIRPRP